MRRFTIDYDPSETMGKIAALFQVSVTVLLDDYHLYGPGKQIKLMRQDRQMTQPEYASCLGVPFGTLQQWEQERVRITKRNWEMLRDRG